MNGAHTLNIVVDLAMVLGFAALWLVVTSQLSWPSILVVSAIGLLATLTITALLAPLYGRDVSGALALESLVDRVDVMSRIAYSFGLCAVYAFGALVVRKEKVSIRSINLTPMHEQVAGLNHILWPVKLVLLALIVFIVFFL